MERTKKSKKLISSSEDVQRRRMELLESVTGARAQMAGMMSRTYKGVRNVYEALGYPEEKDLTYAYYFYKYSRQDIASAIIDRPADKTWAGDIQLLEENTIPTNSKLTKAWNIFNTQYKVIPLLKKVDKLACLGNFSLLLFGFSDVKKVEDFAKPITGTSPKLLFLRPISEGHTTITEWEKNTSSPRFGFPLMYEITPENNDTTTGSANTFKIHYTRILHVHTESLESEVYGRPFLKPVINRLVDIEKILGGDAEMFWRGARPGYTATNQPDYTIGDEELTALDEELTKYEHDLRRFITAQGVDIKALDQQVADPLNHLDAQLQAISAQTGIPKRILIGSERGELSSAQDKNEWLALIKTRQEEMSELVILRPFVDYCMNFNILPKSEYTVFWQDVFAPSEKDKVEIGKSRAEALKVYNDSLGAADILPLKLAGKYLLGLTPEQILEIEETRNDADVMEDQLMREAERAQQQQESSRSEENEETPATESE